MTRNTIVMVGDTSLGDMYLGKPGLEPWAERLRHSPMSFFERLSPLVSDADEFIANLETVLADNPNSPYAKKKRYLGWDDPFRTLDALKNLGVTAVSLANNHTMDFGAATLVDTISALRSAGINTFGAGCNAAEAVKPLVVPLPAARRSLYVIGALQVVPVLRDDFQFYAGSRKPGVNPLSIVSLRAVVAGIRAVDPSAIVVSFPHWGANYKWAGEKARVMARDMEIAGVDLVIGHGAHMMQECEKVNTSLIAYSIGNFVFNSVGRYKKLAAPPYSVVARISVAQGGSMTLRLYPIVSDNMKTGFMPHPVNEREARDFFSVLAARESEKRPLESFFRMDRDDRGWFLESNQ